MAWWRVCRASTLSRSWTGNGSSTAASTSAAAPTHACKVPSNTLKYQWVNQPLFICHMNAKVACLTKLNLTITNNCFKLYCIWFCFVFLSHFVARPAQIRLSIVWLHAKLAHLQTPDFYQSAPKWNLDIVYVSKHVTGLFLPLATGKRPTFRITTERRVRWWSPVTATSSGVPRQPSAAWKGWFMT